MAGENIAVQPFQQQYSSAYIYGVHICKVLLILRAQNVYRNGGFMGEQLIISISREYGSGGHEIARKLADRLELAFYDRCMLDEIAEQMNADVSDFHKYDEKPGNRLLSRRVGNHTNSYEEIIAQFQFDYIRKKAENGESFVVVGRCSENVLKDYD